jgi:hypothetical protein
VVEAVVVAINLVLLIMLNLVVLVVEHTVNLQVVLAILHLLAHHRATMVE